MEFLEITKGLIELGKNLFGLAASLDKAEIDSRTRTAAYLDKIAECLDGIESAFRSKQAPYGLCAELNEYLNGLMSVVGDHMSPAEVERFQEILNRSVFSRQRLYLADSSADEAAALRAIAEASGRFRALANTLRA